MSGVVVMDMVRLEATHMAGLVGQFADLVGAAAAASGMPDDPAVARLVPGAYPDDIDADQEFRSLTQSDLLERRAADAAEVLGTLAAALADAGEETEARVIVSLDRESAEAWLRTFAAVRLVLAERLGVADEDDHDEDDPRFGIYDWLGFRLDALVRAVDDLSA